MTRKSPDLAPGDDPFNLDAIRISQDFSEGLGIEKLLLRVPVRKPTRQEFIRVHDGSDFSVDTVLIELKEDREYYLPAPGAREALLEDLMPVRLLTAINRAGVVFLWPARLPGSDGRTNPWHSSALEIGELAKSHWVRMSASRSLGAYQCYRAAGDLPTPCGPRARASRTCSGSVSPTAF